MPFSTYVPQHMGSATLSPQGPFVAGSHAELTLVYTAGTFGIDDSGMVKVSWRTTSDMAKPQFTEPAAPNYTTVEASNGASLEYWFDRLNIRPWVNTLLIRIGRGFLRAGDTLTIRFGDRRGGSPGLRLQTNCEERFAFKVYVDAFATYEFAELPVSPAFTLVPGRAERWKAILPSLVVAGEPFRLAIVAEDLWGNPARIDRPLVLTPSRPVANLPARIFPKPDDEPHVVNGLVVPEPGDLDVRVQTESGEELARANPMLVVASAPSLRYWGDLHAQSGETVGTNPAESYFRYARDKAFVDIVGHQGNDFQITDKFWHELNELTALFDVPGRFVCVPGYEWSGNTGLGGDRNVFYRNEGRPIHRSSRILVDDQARTPDEDCYTAGDLFAALAGEDAVVIAHVGGRYADIRSAHDVRLECAVEVHSTWGTFEWLLHDAFAQGYRVGVVCHSDDHKGRPGATRPGASTFGAIGGLTCYLMPELTREALFRALRQRRHYGTTGTRLFLDVVGTFSEPVVRFGDDPQLGPAQQESVRSATMGDIIEPGTVPMRLTVDVVGTAPIERLEVFHGAQLAQTYRPYAPGDLGRRLRVLWRGAEYRGRGRETYWKGQLALTGTRASRFAPVNFLNPERQITETKKGTDFAWRSVTTGNLAGIDLWLDDASGFLNIETNIVSGRVDLETLAEGVVTFDGGGLGRELSVYRLPDSDWTHRFTCEHTVERSGTGDLPVYVRVTQADGHQAWSSPIYLIG